MFEEYYKSIQTPSNPAFEDVLNFMISFFEFMKDKKVGNMGQVFDQLIKQVKPYLRKNLVSGRERQRGNSSLRGASTSPATETITKTKRNKIWFGHTSLLQCSCWQWSWCTLRLQTDAISLTSRTSEARIQRLC